MNQASVTSVTLPHAQNEGDKPRGQSLQIGQTAL